MKLSFVLNDDPLVIEAAPQRRVIDLLREDLHRTGSKEGCGTGECGACTILVNGQAQLSCLMVAAQLEGKRITTVEGLASSTAGAIVQQAFVEEGAVQCGFCIPGMEMAALALLQREIAPVRDCIREGLSGNLCRCTGYTKIVDAVERAARELESDQEEP